ncbi:MAG: DUF1573 domain-containing protein [Planctomycetota bacterium]
MTHSRHVLYFLWIVAGLCAAPSIGWVVALAQEPVPAPEPTPVPATGQPKIRLSADQFDFGAMLQGEKWHTNITVYNDGDAALELSPPLPSCGCMEILSYPQTVAAGSSGEIQLEVDSKKIVAGNTRKNLKIRSNDTAAPELIIWFTGDVRVMVVSEPANISMTGLVNESKETTIDLIAGTELGLTITELRSREGLFEIVESKEVSPGKRYRVKLRAKPAAQSGKTRDPLDITVKFSEERVVTVGMWVNIEHINYVTSQPADGVQFGNKDTDKLLKEGAPPLVKAVTVIGNAPDSKFEISGVEFEGVAPGVFEVKVEPQVAGKRYTVSVSLAAYQSQSYLRGKLIVRTTDARCPVIEVPLLARFGKRAG